jgi:hypothetical protein
MDVSGASATIAELAGSRTEFEEGVNIRSTRFLARALPRNTAFRFACRGARSGRPRDKNVVSIHRVFVGAPRLQGTPRCDRRSPARHCRRRSECSWFAQFDDFERRHEIDRRLAGVLYRKATRIAGKMAPHGPRRCLGVALRHEVDEQAVLIESA